MVLLALMTSITIPTLLSRAGVYSLIERVVSTAISLSALISHIPRFPDSAGYDGRT